jgi:hypothetical protein
MNNCSRQGRQRAKIAKEDAESLISSSHGSALALKAYGMDRSHPKFIPHCPWRSWRLGELGANLYFAKFKG